MTLSFTLNGRPVSAEPQPMERLSRTLRLRLGQTGTKVGCDAGDCGACTVLLDGEPVCACLLPAMRAQGRSVETVEGLAGEDGTLSRLQQAFWAQGAAQCGICTPGMLVTAAALLRTNPHPSEAEVSDALGGVLCRCTGYRKIIQAVMMATGFNGPVTAEPAVGQSVGQRLARLDGADKLTGADVFGDDGAPAQALVVVVVRSPYPHAAFSFGDLDAFVARTPGIMGVLTAADIPGENCHGVIPPFRDQVVFAETLARFRGEAVALVAGEAAAMAVFDPASDFPITWEERVPVMTPRDAEAPDAAQLHETRPGNILTRGFVQRGDVDGLDRTGLLTLSHTTTTGFIEHAYIEPEAGWAQLIPDPYGAGDRIEIHACTQAAGIDQEETARILGVAMDRVRIVPTAVGGGFGSKLDVSLQPFLALAAWHFRRPVRMTYSRQESMQSTTKRHPSAITPSLTLDRQGRFQGLEIEAVFNTGAYASWGPTVATRVPVHGTGPYFVPNYRCRSRAVLTHCPPAGAFRGFGVPQMTIALETLIDEAAAALGMDPLDLRLRNALDNGQPTGTGQVFATGVGIRACLEAVADKYRAARQAAAEANRRPGRWRRGVGLAAGWYGCGNTALPNPSTIKAGVTPDGRIVLHQGAIDLGQGANTVIAQLFADALGVSIALVDLLGADTDITPDAGKTSASRQTFVTGNAAVRAGQALRRLILRQANVGPEAVIAREGGRLTVTDAGGTHSPDLSRLDLSPDGYALVAQECYDPPTTKLDENGQGSAYAQFGYCVHMVELAVDTGLGTVRLDRITAAHDVGRAINPTLVEGQIEGGIAQGIGLALMEEYIPGRTENLHDYLIPTFGDVPPIDALIVEVTDPEGPMGAKGLGEHALVPTAAAVLNAIRDATGVLVRDLPVLPHVLKAALDAAATPEAAQ